MARQERSAGFVIFHRVATEIEFLLLDYGRHWDFPKGHVEKGEEDLTAALRELREETGIADPKVIEGFQQETIYFFRHPKRGLIRKTVLFFLAETSARNITLSHEHTGFAFLPYQQARAKLTFPTARLLLDAAWKFVEEFPLAVRLE
jgi:bis(5'-nucleosidyl)-tetraphosphatase